MIKERLTNEDVDALGLVVIAGMRDDADEYTIQQAELAREKLLIAHMPLANAQARKYIGKITQDEAESTAYLGLTIAMKSWNPEKGALASWIRLYTKMVLIREVNRQTLIKIPMDLAPKRKLVQQLIKEKKDMSIIKKETKLTTEQITNLANSPSVVAWLDDENNNIDISTKETGSTTLDGLLGCLTEEQLLVICTKFEIDYYGTLYTLDELKDKFKMTDHEIKLLELEALKKLKMFDDNGVFTYSND
jgi:DNA-directed RNA polymerase sigma subunit (sigma70/sigma32)